MCNGRRDVEVEPVAPLLLGIALGKAQGMKNTRGYTCIFLKHTTPTNPKVLKL